MAQILSMGELLIDFTPSGTSPDGQMLFARNPGGAPANVAVQARRVGVSAGFLGCVGNDMFGNFLRHILVRCGVDARGLALNPDYATSLAFVQLNEHGDRNFSFYRNPGADTRLSYDEADLSLIDECELLCFGSLLLTAEPSKSSVPKLVKYAKSRGKITAYDPNWRSPLWKTQAEGIKAMKSLIGMADIMKVSEEELKLLTDKESISQGAEILLGQGVQMAVVTLGSAGCKVFTESYSVEEPTYDTKVVDTTGCGDSFFGALLGKIVQLGKRPSELTQPQLKDIVDFANAAGSVCAAKTGAIPALPNVEAIEECRKTVPRLIR